MCLNALDAGGMVDLGDEGGCLVGGSCFRQLHSPPAIPAALNGHRFGMIGNPPQVLPSTQGDPQAAEEMLPLVYAELRKLAAMRMGNEPPGQTLQATALVHEAWLRLTDEGGQDWNSRGHFFAAAAEAMRRILVENARRKHRIKHGGELQRTSLTGLDLAQNTPDEHLLAVDEALDRLAALDPVGAGLVKLRFFVGLPNAEAARLLGIPERSAKRTWAYARAWLHEELKQSL
jgi:RNA polymerase sigma factor (TIGR02999 family)